MKLYKQMLGFICFCSILFAFSFRSYAIDFDAEEAYKSVFVIFSGNYEGSGFAIGSNAIVTNAHVIDDVNDIIVKSYYGDDYKASIYLYNESLDIAILCVDNAEFIPLEVGDFDAIKVGDDIYAIGAPQSLDYSLTKGVISNKSRKIGFTNYIQIDAAINSGNSGGPLLNNYGQVIGVNTLKLSDSEGIGLSIPISSVISFMEGNDVEIRNNSVNGKIENNHDDLYIDNKSDTFVKIEHDYSLSIVLGIFLSISIVFNVILIVKMAYKKNKDVVVQEDPRERTDFDIDILE